MSATGPILVTGATGQQGGAVAWHLLRSGVPVRALTRDAHSPSARALQQRGVEIAQGDLRDPPSLTRALEGVERVFSVQDFYAKGVGYAGEIEQGRNLARACAQAKVAHLVQSTMAYTSDAQSVRHFESKFAIEREFESLGVPFTFVGTVWFMDNLFNQKNGGTLSFPALTGSLHKKTLFHMLAVDDLGAAVAHVLTQPAAHIGKRVDLAGDTLTIDVMRATYRDIFGPLPHSWGMPAWALKWASPEFAAQLAWHNRVGWKFDRSALATLVPNAHTFATFLREKREQMNTKNA
jgi:uncharacterized protein YbjT (DUF2867 family)